MRRKSWILILSTCLVFTALILGSFIKDDVEFSPNENRYLKQMPKLSLDSIVSGKFEADFEEYLNDQIIGREFWVKTMASIENSVGIKDVNGTYVAENNRLVERVTEQDFDQKRYEENLREVRKLRDVLKKKKGKFNLLLAPTAADIYKSELPYKALVFNEKKAFEKGKKLLGADFIDIRERIKESPVNRRKYDLSYNGDKYFLTDHHWTNYGAFLAYCEFAKTYGKTLNYDDYAGSDQVVLTDRFMGTLYSKVMFQEHTFDIIEVPKDALEKKCSVKIEGKKYPSIFFLDRLEQKDKYEVYFGGNYDKVDIDTGNKGETLLIIKDSYANSFVPHILGDFRKITMVDTRFYRDNILELAKKYDRVLVLYSITNFSKEKLVLTNSLLQ